MSAAARFWLKVEKTATCWLWRAAISSEGYGSFAGGYAHRFSYELHIGPIPAGLMVCHTCDVRHCVNPAHFFLGDHVANAKDMYAKGRSVQQTRPQLLVRGEQVNTARLTSAQVIEIRKRYAAGGTTLTQLATTYGVATSVIHKVVARLSWRHVPEVA